MQKAPKKVSLQKWCAFALRLSARASHCAPFGPAHKFAVDLVPIKSGTTIPERKLEEYEQLALFLKTKHPRI